VDLAATDRLEGLLALLRQNGGRVTRPRRAILAAMVARGSHVTADDLAADVQATHPEVHLSTVYRTLDALAELGVLTHVHLGHGRAVFHMAGEGHQHLVCERCGGVTEAPDELFDDLADRLDGLYGFELRPEHFALTGRCRACR
jgi:Fur family transcriptional regulator, ferric uptake regulator